jgi:hypothetical protein
MAYRVVFAYQVTVIIIDCMGKEQIFTLCPVSSNSSDNLSLNAEIPALKGYAGPISAIFIEH